MSLSIAESITFRQSLFALIVMLLYVSITQASTQTLHNLNDAEPPLPDVNSFEGWELQLDKEGVQIYTRKWPGSSFVAVKTVQIIDSSLSNIMGNFLDIESFPEWVDDMKEGRLVEDFNEQKQRIVYMHMGLPWPLNDRDVVIQQKLQQDPTNFEVRMTETRVEKLIPEQDGVIRIPRVNSEFVLQALPEGGVRMTWQGHNEPGGFIPPFLVNWMIENVFFKSSLNMRERFESLEYFQPSKLVADPS